MHVDFSQCWNAENTELPGNWYGAWLAVSVYSKGWTTEGLRFDSCQRHHSFLYTAQTDAELHPVIQCEPQVPSLRSSGGNVKLHTQFQLVPRLVVHGTVPPIPFLKRFIAQTVYTVCTRINCKIVPVTSLNKY
jgi:hypothetical protein